jgi:hypothetical protein
VEVPDEVFDARVSVALSRKDRIRRLLTDVLQEGTHYLRGNRPRLLVAGAEEIFRLWGVVPMAEPYTEYGDGIQTPHVSVIVRVTALVEAQALTCGVGASNSLEWWCKPFLKQPWNLHHKVVDMASDRAKINCVLGMGFNQVFEESSDLFMLPDEGGSIPIAS